MEWRVFKTIHHEFKNVNEVLTSIASTRPNAGFARFRKNMWRIWMLNSTNPELT